MDFFDCPWRNYDTLVGDDIESLEDYEILYRALDGLSGTEKLIVRYKNGIEPGIDFQDRV